MGGQVWQVLATQASKQLFQNQFSYLLNMKRWLKGLVFIFLFIYLVNKQTNKKTDLLLSE